MLSSGYLLLNKKAGLTSFQSLAAVKKAFGTGKVCHTGTLDKFAEGLLIVLVGRAVKLSALFTACDKRYSARLVIGEETDTLDPEGEVTARAAPCSREAFEAVIPDFTGRILQAPPLYSAVHVDGKRAHELARSGAAVEMKKRPVMVYSIALNGWDAVDGRVFAGIAVHCSSGTYIRSLGRDMALAAGTRACLAALKRGAAGGFSLDDAVPSDAPGKDLVSALRPIDRTLFSALPLPVFVTGEDGARAFLRGGDLRGILPQDAVPGSADGVRAAVFGPDGFAGVVEYRIGRWKYGFVYGVEHDHR